MRILLFLAALLWAGLASAEIPVSGYRADITNDYAVNDISQSMDSCQSMTASFTPGVSGAVTLYATDSDDDTVAEVEAATLVKAFTTKETYGPFSPDRRELRFVVDTQETGTQPSRLELTCDSFFPLRMGKSEFDSTGDPVGLWTFEDALTDASGNGNTLTMTQGTQLWGSIDGLWGIDCSQGTTSDEWLVNGAPTNIPTLGDLTVSVMVYVEPDACCDPDTRYGVVSMAGYDADETATQNYNWGIHLETNSNYRFLSENGAGVDEEAEESGGGADKVLLYQPQLITYTRESDVVKLYLDGQLRTTFAAGTTPTSGTAASLNVCANAGTPTGTDFFEGLILGLKIYDRALTASEILTEAQKTGFAR